MLIKILNNVSYFSENCYSSKKIYTIRMNRQKIPPGLGKWSTISNICPECIPDSNDEINLYACHDCLMTHLEQIDYSRACNICSQALKGTICPNRSCHDVIRPYGRVFAIGYHQEKTLLLNLINSLKYYGVKLNAIPLAALLWGELSTNHARYKSYDFIAPVPRTVLDIQSKGDPLLLVLKLTLQFINSLGPKNIYKKIMIGDENPLSKVLATPRSPGLSVASKRRTAHGIANRSIQNPYSINKTLSVFDKSVLVIDDVFTSGYHTMFPIGEALKAAGAGKIDALVLGRRGWQY